MVNIYQTNEGKIEVLSDIATGAWVHMTAPTQSEINHVCSTLNLDQDIVKAALDEEERSRIEKEDNAMLILVDTPIVEADGRSFVYATIPFGIILTEDNIITICLKETALVRAFIENAVKNFSTKKRNRMTLQLLYKNSALFLYYLREVDKASIRTENELYVTMKNKELIQMLGLEKSLVYFSTSLKSNEIVLEKLFRSKFISSYPDDNELLEDVIIENKQAIEMANIYRDILSGTMDAFASVISNNLNIVMKVLAVITIILTVPSIIFGLWGTNVPVPFANNPYGFWIIIGVSIAFTLLSILLMVKKKWL